MSDGGQKPLVRSIVLVPDFEELTRARQFVAEAAAEVGFPEARVFDITVACSEAAANAIEHVPVKGEVTLNTLQYPDRLEVQVVGPGEFRAPHRLKNGRSHRGLGLPLMAQFSDHLALYSGPSGGTLVSLTFYRPGVEPAGEEPMPPSFRDLMDENEFVSAITGSAPVGLAVLGSDLHFKWTNPAFRQLLEGPYRSEDVLTGQFAGDVVPSTKESGRLAELREASRTGVPTGPVEFAIEDRSGAVKWWRRNAVPLVSSAPAPPYDLLLMITDETERVQAEQALRASEAEFRTIFDSSRPADVMTVRSLLRAIWQEVAEGEVVRDADGKVTAWRLGEGSEVLRSAFRVADIGATSSGNGPTTGGDGRWLLTIAQVVDSGRPVCFEHQTPAGDLWLEAVIVPLGGDRFVMGCDDITARKRAEESLRASEEKYRELYNSIDEGFVTLDVIFDQRGRVADLYYVEANPAAIRLLGRDFTGTRWREVAPTSEELWYELAGRVALTGESARVRRRVEPGGRWLDSLFFRIGDEGSRRIGMVFEDVTEEARREGDLRFLVQVDRLLSGGLAAADIVPRVGEMLGDHLRVDNFVLAEAEEAEDRSRLLSAWRDERAAKLLETHRLSELNGPEYWEAMHQGVPYVVDDVRTDPRTDDARHAEFGVFAFVVVPLDRDSRWKYLVSVDSAMPRDWTEAEVNLVREVAVRVVARIERAQAEEELRANEESYRLLAEENERLYRQQLDIAEHLQQALLNIPSEIGRIRLGHLYRSATETARVGGDFYDVFEAKEGHIAVLMGDVAGHGIQAARTGTLVKDVVHAFTHQSLRPHEVLRRTNLLLIEKELPEFVTLFLGILDPVAGTLRYSSAGHPESMVKRVSGDIVMLGCGTSPLGVYADASWKPHEISLEPGDLLLLYTDGVTEARRGVELFGEKRLERLLRRKRVSPGRLPHLILDQVLAFSGGSLNDDAAVLVVSLTEPSEGAAGRAIPVQQKLLDV